MKFSGLERRERKKTKRRLMKVKLIKSYVSEVGFTAKVSNEGDSSEMDCTTRRAAS